MFILTCVNEVHDVVKVSTFNSHENAFEAMKAEFEKELKLFREYQGGFVYQRPYHYPPCTSVCHISNDVYGYWWTISEVDEPIIQDKIEFNSFEIKADGENLYIRDKEIGKRMAIIPEVSNVVRIVRV